MGAANIRTQGLEGRYTQLLADNLPLYGGQAATLGLLQIPPTDLGQVEVITGSASALYGAFALGGVINLVSKRPGDAFEAEVLGNVTTRNGQDLTAYAAGPLSGNSGLSLTAGAHR
ncbi:MAG: TonB-dependent receptor plug domain-containing protein [Nitrobacter sp.]|uniref:TonB-dependent receptor plug domain-containing protein n=1 Tax=Nitrobacter sp. TaxID=29420 RepID=UPI00260B8184|nr:TonB-dependent receptor plug domain-containing protein [Nitrobacter sp.]MCV0386072.1 TonB-dependent receptor plug domain-containing protein [Nitrobacter sp.]